MGSTPQGPDHTGECLAGTGGLLRWAAVISRRPTSRWLRSAPQVPSPPTCRPPSSLRWMIEATARARRRAPRLFEEVLVLPGAGRWPFAVARVQLGYGERPRRAQAPRPGARPPFTDAAGTRDRDAGRRRHEQQADPAAAVPVAPDRQRSPVPDLPETWHHVPDGDARCMPRPEGVVTI